MLSKHAVFVLLIFLTIHLFALGSAKKFSLNYRPTTSPRIINGTVANWNDTKHQISLRRRINDSYLFGTGHACGGSLIADNVVLTALHCVASLITGELYPLENFVVVAGTLNRFERTNETLVFDIEKGEFYVNYLNVSTYEHDIAILYLNDSVPAHYATVEPIQIDPTPVADDTICQVTGWGITEENMLSDVLKTVDVPIINTEVCDKESDFDEGTILPGMLCAGYLKEGERDACGGDSGGPLVCNRKLSGIVSWGYGCALPNLPGVYADISFYSRWISERLAANNITLPGGDHDDDGNGGGARSSFSNSIFMLIATTTLALSVFYRSP